MHVGAWRAAYRGILAAQLLDGLSVGLRADFWAGVLAAPGAGSGTLTLVAQDDPAGAVAGFCSLALPSRDDDAGERTAEVVATYVDPARWGGGVGRALLGEALERLRVGARPWDDVTLWIFLRNAQGRAFHARSGFRLDGAKAVHEPTGVTTARMRLAL